MTSNQRDSYRSPVPSGHEAAVLHIGKRPIDVRLVNTSATGFLLECPKLDVRKGDLLLLITSAECSEIRVAYVETQDSLCRLGVQRVRELSDDSAPSDWRHLLFGTYQQVGGIGGVFITGCLLGVVLAIGASLLARVWPPARQFDFSPMVTKFATSVAESLRQTTGANGSPPIRQVSTSSSSGPGSTTTRFIELWRTGKANELSAHLQLSKSQVSRLNELLSSGNDSATIQRRLEEILTAAQMRVIQSE